MCYLHLPTLGAGAFCCDFTRALFLTTCATKSCCWDVLFGLVVLMAFLCTFLLHFNDEHHHTVLMAIASLTPLTEGRSARDIPKQPPAKKQKKLVASYSPIRFLMILQHLRTFGTSGAFLSGRLQCRWCCFVFVFDFVALLGTIYPVFLRHFHPVVADRRATARTTETLSHAATSQKKA